MRRPPIRARVTGVFALVMAAVLVLTGTLIFLEFRSSLDDSINETLFQQADEIIDSASFDEPPDELLPGEVAVDPLAVGSLSAFLGPNGEVIATSSVALEALDLGAETVGEPVDVELPSGPGEPPVPARVLVLPVGDALPGEVFVAVGTTLEARQDSLSNLRLLLVVGLTAALVVSSAAAFAVTSASLRPVEAMRRRAANISGKLRGERLPAGGSGDEIARLGTTMNDLLERVEGASERERAFLADASHELRTPLTTLRAELDLADRDDTTEAELRESVRQARAEATRLSRLAESLLTVARADAGELAGTPQTVRLAPVADAVASRAAGAGTEAGRAVTVAVPDDLVAWGDPRLLDTALTALVDNALVHGAGEIAIGGQSHHGESVVTVTDEGPGFAEDFLPRAFERFARADGSRTAAGTGLGLSIVAAIAAATGGRAEAANESGGGAVVRIVLPKGSGAGRL